MKKPKTIIPQIPIPFSFKDKTRQQMVDYLNERYPISLKYNEDLVNRVHARYPIIDKSEVGIIVKAVFSSFRDLLVLGKVLCFDRFFTARIYAFPFRKNNRVLPAIRIKMTTPEIMRK